MRVRVRVRVGVKVYISRVILDSALARLLLEGNRRSQDFGRAGIRVVASLMQL